MSGATMAEACIAWARAHEREARALRVLASKIEHPPEGVTVEYVPPNVVRFVGPPIDTRTPP